MVLYLLRLGSSIVFPDTYMPKLNDSAPTLGTIQ